MQEILFQLLIVNGFVVNQTRHITCGQNSTYGQLPISAKTSEACFVEGVRSRQSVVLIYWLVEHSIFTIRVCTKFGVCLLFDHGEASIQKIEND